MTEKCSVDGCQVQSTGVCALHGVEVERREQTQKAVAEIPNLVVMSKTILGCLSLLIIIVSGNFYYTKEVKADVAADVDEVKSVQKVTDAKVQKLSIDFEGYRSGTEQRFIAMGEKE